MKYLLLSLFCALAVFNVSAQLNGTFIGDWQNNLLQQCQPESLVITTVNATTSNISITFSPSNIGLCSQLPFNISSNYTDVLTDNGGVWTDGKGWTITNSNGILTYTYGGAGNIGLLYSASGAIFSQQDSLGGIGGIWESPFNVSPNSNASICCVPDSLYLTLADSQDRLSSVFSFTSTNCSTNATLEGRFSILAPQSSSLIWSNLATLGQGPYNVVFDPNTSLAGLVLTWPTNSSCQYGYIRNNNTNLNSTWMKDWQSTPGSDFVNLTTYQVTTVSKLNGTYMISNNTNNGTVSNSFVVQTPNGTYYDAFLNNGTGVTFSYSNSTNTLLDSPDSLLLSTNGALLTNAPFLGNWTNGVALTNSSLPEGCCIPTQVNISATAGVESPLNVMYQLPSDWQNVLGCVDLGSAVDAQGVISSTLIRSGPPSLTALTWYDNSFNSTIITASGSNLNIQNMTLGCGFSMSINTNPPAPLAGSIVSTGIVSLVLGFVMLAF